MGKLRPETQDSRVPLQNSLFRRALEKLRNLFSVGMSDSLLFQVLEIIQDRLGKKKPLVGLFILILETEFLCLIELIIEHVGVGQVGRDPERARIDRKTLLSGFNGIMRTSCNQINPRKGPVATLIVRFAANRFLAIRNG